MKRRVQIANVRNIPAYAKEYAYIVARIFDGEMWYYGAWATEIDAKIAANNVGGVMLRNIEVEVEE